MIEIFQLKNLETHRKANYVINDISLEFKYYYFLLLIIRLMEDKNKTMF
jgi:hypothetical protein